MQLNRVPQGDLLNIQDESISQQKACSKRWTKKKHCSVTDYPSTQGGKRSSIASTCDNNDQEGQQRYSLLTRPYHANKSFFSSQMARTYTSIPQKVGSKTLPQPQGSHCYNRAVLNKNDPCIFSENQRQVEVSSYTQIKDLLQRKYIADKRPKAVPNLSLHQQNHSDFKPAPESKQLELKENQEVQECKELHTDDQECNSENGYKEENTCEFREMQRSNFSENLRSLVDRRKQQKRALSNPNKSELIKLNQQFEGTSQKMMDLRLNLLSTIAQKKLGLLKKQSKAEKMISRFRKEMPEAENDLKQQTSSAVERMFNNSTIYDHVRSKITQTKDSNKSRLNFTQDDSINQKIKDICTENKDQKQPLAHSGNKATDGLSPSSSVQHIKYQEPMLDITNKLRIHSLDNFKKQKQNKLTIGQIYTDDEQKTKKSTLKQFMKTYNQYINNILWQTTDSFLKMKRCQYLAKCKAHQHQKSSNVFKRLEQDQSQWKLQKLINMQEYASKYKGASPQRQLLPQRTPSRLKKKHLRTLQEFQGSQDNGAKSGLIKKHLESFQSGMKASTSQLIETNSPPVLDLTVINNTQQQL